MSSVEKPAKLFDDSVSIEALQPDFVISALYTFNHKADTANKEANLDLKNLLQVLVGHGFLVQIRPGKGVDRVLVFVKLTAAALQQAIQQANASDFVYDINNDLFAEAAAADLSRVDEADKLRIIYTLLTNDPSERGLGLTPKLGKWSFIESIQPIHNSNANQALISKWSKNYTIEETDIDLLKHQYGTKIALYFAFLKFYLKWLTVPAAIGVLNYVTLGYKFSVGYTFLNLVWSVFFLQAWNRKERTYAIKWNVKNVTPSTLQLNNQNFKPEKVTTNYVTGEQNFKYYPSYKRFLKKIAFFPVALAFAGALIGWQFVCFFVEIFINELYNGPLKSVFALVPIAMLAVFVPILTFVYKKVIGHIVQWENHRTMLSYSNSVNEKLFVISFLTSYMALFITTFIYFPLGHMVNDFLTSIELFIHTKVHHSFPIKVDHYVIDPQRMHAQFFFSIVTNQVLQFFLEYFLPFGQRVLTEKWESRHTDVFFDYNDADDEKDYLIEIRRQVYELGEYDVSDDFRTLIVQFGYLVFFSQCWTIAPFICLVLNYIQFIGDATKIFVENKRPIPTRTNSIYPWNQFLSLLVWLSSIIAPAITAMYRNSENILGKVDSLTLVEKRFRETSVSIQSWGLLTVIIFSEHVYLILNYVLSLLFSKTDSPEGKADLKESLSLKKRFVDKYLPSVSTAAPSGDAISIEKKWLQLGSNDGSTLLDLANQVTRNVKQSTRAKHAATAPAPQPGSRPSVPAPTGEKSEFIDEKIGQTGSYATNESGIRERRVVDADPSTVASKEAQSKTGY